MIKTNSKIFRENLKKYIVGCFNFEQYTEDTGKTLEHSFDSVKVAILESFNKEKYYSNSYALAHGVRPSTMFRDWCCGLPTYLICDDFVLGNAVETLGNLLEQTETEKARYSEMDSMNLLIDLIYRELTRWKEQLWEIFCT